MSREQGGFRDGRSTLDQIQALDMVLKLCKEKGKPAHVAFLEIKAAYDSILRKVLSKRCGEIGIYPLVISCLQNVHRTF